MKRITLTLLGLVAFSTTAVAQQEVKFGPKAGVNFANIAGKDAEDRHPGRRTRPADRLPGNREDVAARAGVR